MTTECGVISMTTECGVISMITECGVISKAINWTAQMQFYNGEIETVKSKLYCDVQDV